MPAGKTVRHRYRPKDPFKGRLRRLIHAEIDRVQALWEKFASFLGPWMFRYEQAVGRFLGCGLLENGFSLWRCSDCGYTLKAAFSCKSRLCPSCTRKRMTLWSEWLTSEVLLDLPHRHWVFTIPPELRKHFEVR